MGQHPYAGDVMQPKTAQPSLTPRSLEATKRRAVGRIAGPGVDQGKDAGERVPDGRALVLLAVQCADRPFAVLVDDNEESTLEPVRIVEVERPSEVAFVIDELVHVLRSFKRSHAIFDPRLANLDDGRGACSSMQRSPDAQPPGTRCLVDRECAVLDVETVAIEEVRDAREVAVETVVREAQARLHRLQIADALARSNGWQLGNSTADDAALGRHPSARVELEGRDRDPDDAL